MKKLLLAVLLTASLASAQPRFFDREYFYASVAVDPSASLKEKGADIYGELGLISHFGYVSAGIESFSALKGSYLALNGTFGLNVTTGYFDDWRIYSGLRLGVIKRGMGEGQTQTYPLAGVEGGVDYMVSENIYVGVRATYDHREDMLYSGAEPEARWSGWAKAGIRFW